MGFKEKLNVEMYSVWQTTCAEREFQSLGQAIEKTAPFTKEVLENGYMKCRQNI